MLTYLIVLWTLINKSSFWLLAGGASLRERIVLFANEIKINYFISITSYISLSYELKYNGCLILMSSGMPYIFFTHFRIPKGDFFLLAAATAATAAWLPPTATPRWAPAAGPFNMKNAWNDRLPCRQQNHIIREILYKITSKCLKEIQCLSDNMTSDSMTII